MKNAKNEPHDGLEILHRRYYEGRPEQAASLEEERVNARTAREIYELRHKAGLSQRELARLVGTTASVICRLEDADYEGHSLGMLRRIAAALNRRVEIRFVPAKRRSVVVKKPNKKQTHAARGARRRRSRVQLKELISRVTPESLEPTYDWGPDVGSEIIS